MAMGRVSPLSAAYLRAAGEESDLPTGGLPSESLSTCFIDRDPLLNRHNMKSIRDRGSDARGNAKPAHTKKAPEEHRDSSAEFAFAIAVATSQNLDSHQADPLCGQNSGSK